MGRYQLCWKITPKKGNQGNTGLVHSIGLFCLLRHWNRKAFDVEKVTKLLDHHLCPPQVYHCGDHKVCVQIEQLRISGHWLTVVSSEFSTLHSQTKRVRVYEESSRHQRDEEGGKEGERSEDEVSEDDFGGHSPENERHCQCEKHQMVVTQNARIRGE